MKCPECDREFETKQAMMTHQNNIVYADDEILDDIRTAFEKHDGVLTATAFIDRVDYSLSVVRYRFGSWNTALQEAGLPTVDEQAEIALLDEIRDCAKELDKIPTIDEFKEFSTCNHAVHRHFGTWNQALTESGITERDKHDGQGPKPNDIDVIRDIRAFVDERGFVPLCHQFTETVDYTSKSIQLRHGTWEEAVQAAGFDYSSNEKRSESLSGENHPLFGTERSEETKRKISESLKLK